MEKQFIEYEKCILCPRQCRVNRNAQHQGACGVTAELRLARAALHYWEEPCISGSKGSGAVFFTGCAMHCVFCQNQSIASGEVGKAIEKERLVQIFLELQEQEACNINLVTASQYLPHVIWAVEQANKQGLQIPIVYNCGGYELVDSIKRLEGIVDIYLPDFKYWTDEISAKYSKAPDYRQRALEAIAEMYRQQPKPAFFEKDGQHLMKCGVMVRHLLLPGRLYDAKQILKTLYDRYHNEIYYSLMSQYTPLAHVAPYEELQKTVTKEAYQHLVDYALSLGITTGFMQEMEVAKESFIPHFDYQGV